jgi:xeroderma pigmentosum group C-complementing protein
LEQIDLANHLLKEPVPKKIDDFRHHPLYVLKRHLKRNEMLSPGAIHVSALTSGKGMNLKTEYVYKRKDVVACFSAREWFRRGQIIKVIESIFITLMEGR